MSQTAVATEVQRDLATIETILAISPIPGADSIEVARIRGWDVVVGRGQYAVGDLVIYVEVDSFLPLSDARFAFLAQRGARTDEHGVEGHVVKTARMRGQISQGIVFDPADFDEVAYLDPGDDVTAILGITKWDPPLPAELLAEARGWLPQWISPSSELRVQNFTEILTESTGTTGWIATEKVDGMSMTVWSSRDDRGVSGRNVDFLDVDGNRFWSVARSLDLHTLIREQYGACAVAVQGELYGPGIAGNPLRVQTLAFAAFALYVDGRELPRREWPQWLLDIAAPVFNLDIPATVEEATDQANAVRSAINPQRRAEGIVWRHSLASHVRLRGGREVRARFKVISPAYLLKADR